MDDYLKSDYIIEDRIFVDKIPAILFRPKEKKGLLPSIILYHGWSSNKERQRMRGFILAAAGYQVIIPDAIYHGERNPLSDYDAKNIGKYFWSVILNNLEESSTIIDELISKYNSDPDRIGICGHSMGGFTASGIFANNPNVKALVVFNGSCAWEHTNEIYSAFFNKESIEKTNAEKLYVLKDKIAKLDPMNNLKLLKNRPVLLLHGDSDNSVPVESQRLFYKTVQPIYDDKDKIKYIEYPNLNHFVTTNMMEECIAWFYKYL